eukprot:1021724-Prorocentrum_minimum.AAC.3
MLSCAWLSDSLQPQRRGDRFGHTSPRQRQFRSFDPAFRFDPAADSPPHLLPPGGGEERRGGWQRPRVGKGGLGAAPPPADRLRVVAPGQQGVQRQVAAGVAGGGAGQVREQVPAAVRAQRPQQPRVAQQRLRRRRGGVRPAPPRHRHAPRVAEVGHGAPPGGRHPPRWRLRGRLRRRRPPAILRHLSPIARPPNPLSALAAFQQGRDLPSPPNAPPLTHLEDASGTLHFSRVLRLMGDS